MRTAIYARYSSTLQDERSIEDQVRICQERAAREGWQVTQVFTDYAVSGAVRDRPGLNAMLAHITAGNADQLMAEALDRISRQMRDMAEVHERIAHAGARIFTLSEGEVGEMHIGMGGTMASMFRKNLADKIRRGQSGRVAAGRTPGGLVYGHRKVIKLNAKGEPELGLREIDEDQAVIIRRIWREWLEGESPLAIVRRLNAEGVTAPKGKHWSVSMVHGDAKRGNGILCNEVYSGTLVYNRTRMVRDPDSRKRLVRINPPDLWQRQPVPHLQIIPLDWWQQGQARRQANAFTPIVRQRRARHLLSGLLTCGQCGGTYIIINNDEWGCGNARQSGTCTNRRKITNPKLEARVLAGLERELLSPERMSLAIRAYHEERAQIAKERARADDHRTRRLKDIDGKITRLVEAISSSDANIPELVKALQALRAEKETLASQSAGTEAANVILLHPAVADAYRKAVQNLTKVLEADPESRRAAHKILRTLINKVTLTPTKTESGLQINLEGHLQSILALSKGTQNKTSTKLVAEEGLELYRGLSNISI